MTPPFPFVVGCGRSGTTLVRAILNAHPDMAVPGESYWVVWLGRNRARYRAVGGFDQERFQADLIAHAWYRRWELPDEQVRAALDDANPQSFDQAVRVVYRTYARHHGKLRFGDKTPLYVEHLQFLSNLLPESVFIEVVRDGRDVARSLLEADWGPRGWEQAAMHWRSQVAQGRRGGQVLGPHRYRQLKYEDLLEDPEREVRALCPLLELDFHPAMLRYFDDADTLLTSEPYPHEHQNLVLPPTKGLRDWRRDVSADDIARFEALAGPLLTELGYERWHPTLTGPERVRSVRVRANWQIRRARDRTRSRVARSIGR